MGAPESGINRIGTVAGLSGFNGAGALELRKGEIHETVRGFIRLLQWGRSVGAPESVVRDGQIITAGRASMGPERGSSGKVMKPFHGNGWRVRFNGAGAWELRKGEGTIALYPAGSMGFNGAGAWELRKAVPVARRIPSAVKLQWGRSVGAPESRDG